MVSAPVQELHITDNVTCSNKWINKFVWRIFQKWNQCGNPDVWDGSNGTFQTFQKKNKSQQMLTKREQYFFERIDMVDTVIPNTLPLLK